MSEVFADAGYWIALVLPSDQLGERAEIVGSALGDMTIVTTQMVLIEVFNYAGRRGPQARLAAVNLWRQIENSAQVEILPVTDAQFRAAVERYATRLDQRWSLVDCASFIIMEERNIAHALAYDRDFEQAGFVALLREGRI